MKTATIEKIHEINPIVGADRIELASIQGYQSVIKKGDFQVGDSVIFVQPDSLIPAKEWSAFLFKDKKTHFRTKTVRLKGAISDGIVFPMGILPDGAYDEGQEVSEVLGITHYEKTIPAQLAGFVKSSFPTLLFPKTDSPRLKTEFNMFEESQGIEFVGLLKIDGSSCSVYNKDCVFGVCSRNQELKEDENNSYWKVANKYNLKNVLPDGYAVQYETYGEGIQGNPLGIKGVDGLAFDVYDIITRRYLDFDTQVEFIQGIGMSMPRIVWRGVFNWASIAEMQEYANIQVYDNGKPAEGIVWKPAIEEFSQKSRMRLQYKTINQNYKD